MTGWKFFNGALYSSNCTAVFTNVTANRRNSTGVCIIIIAD